MSADLDVLKAAVGSVNQETVMQKRMPETESPKRQRVSPEQWRSYEADAEGGPLPPAVVTEQSIERLRERLERIGEGAAEREPRRNRS